MANSFINKKADLTTTDLTTLYTVPSFKSAVIKSILVSNDSGGASDVTIVLVDASSNTFAIETQTSVAARTKTQILTQPLVMEESEALKVNASVADRIHVIASILEIQPREVTT